MNRVYKINNIASELRLNFQVVSKDNYGRPPTWHFLCENALLFL